MVKKPGRGIKVDATEEARNQSASPFFRSSNACDMHSWTQVLVLRGKEAFTLYKSP